MDARARLFHYRRQVRALSAVFREFEDADEIVDSLYMPKSYKGKRHPRLRKALRDRLLVDLRSALVILSAEFEADDLADPDWHGVELPPVKWLDLETP